MRKMIFSHSCRYYWRALLLVVILSLGFAGCATPGGSTPPIPTDLAALESTVHRLVNQHRVSIGRPSLVYDDRIAGQARLHSQDMAAGRVAFGHAGFSGRVAAIGIPYSAAAENIAMNQGYEDPAATAVMGWLGSPGHRANIEGGYDLTGVGAARNERGEYYFTQIFLRR